MNPQPHAESPLQPSQTTPISRLENCDAVMIAIGPTRYLIVRREDAKRVTPLERICKRIRDLKPGDEIFYHGRRETVFGVCAY